MKGDFNNERRKNIRQKAYRRCNDSDAKESRKLSGGTERTRFRLKIKQYPPTTIFENSACCCYSERRFKGNL